jgi:hypothetical protein
MKKKLRGIMVEEILPQRRSVEHLERRRKGGRLKGLPPKPGPVLVQELAAGQESSGNEKRGPAGFGGAPLGIGGREDADPFYVPAEIRRNAGGRAGRQDKEEKES